MQKIKAALFDLDGTIVDSDNLHFSSWNQSLKQFNVNLKYDDYIHNLAGFPSSLNAEHLIEKYSLLISIEELSLLKDENTKYNLEKGEIKFMPEAIETLDYFSNQNIPLFLVTGSPRNEVDIILGKNNLNKFFEFAITRTDVTNSKPSPESYLKAVKKSNINPVNIIVFEDTKNGVTAAKSAGLTCFAIQSNFEIQKKLINADMIFKNFGEATNYLRNNNLI